MPMMTTSNPTADDQRKDFRTAIVTLLQRIGVVPTRGADVWQQACLSLETAATSAITPSDSSKDRFLSRVSRWTA